MNLILPSKYKQHIYIKKFKNGLQTPVLLICEPSLQKPPQKEEIAAFRQTLLRFRTEEQWYSASLDKLVYSTEKLFFGDQNLNLTSLVIDFALRYPPDRKFSILGNFVRMLDICEIITYSYVLNISDILRSNRQIISEPFSIYEFANAQFQILEKTRSGQALLLAFGSELTNRIYNVYYTINEYRYENPLDNLIELPYGQRMFSYGLIREMFAIAKIPFPEKQVIPSIKSLLLSVGDRTFWHYWEGSLEEFASMKFSVGSYTISGAELLVNKPLPIILNQSQLALPNSHKNKKANQKRLVETNFPFPDLLLKDELKKIFHQIDSSTLATNSFSVANARKIRINILGREVSLHYLMMRYCYAKLIKNTKKLHIIGMSFTEVQNHPKLKKLLKSNSGVLAEMLDTAEIVHNISLKKGTKRK